VFSFVPHIKGLLKVVSSTGIYIGQMVMRLLLWKRAHICPTVLANRFSMQDDWTFLIYVMPFTSTIPYDEQVEILLTFVFCLAFT